MRVGLCAGSHHGSMWLGVAVAVFQSHGLGLSG
jgi:hypothetical protein